jgi:hypothetical protein
MDTSEYHLRCRFKAGENERSNHRGSLRQELHRGMRMPSALALRSLARLSVLGTRSGTRSSRTETKWLGHFLFASEVHNEAQRSKSLD